jgi:hypothetical protein
MKVGDLIRFETKDFIKGELQTVQKIGRVKKHTFNTKGIGSWYNIEVGNDSRNYIIIKEVPQDFKINGEEVTLIKIFDEPINLRLLT